MGLADDIAGLGGNVELVMGVVDEVNDTNGRVTVNVGGKKIPDRLWVGGTVPYLGDPVAVLRAGNQFLVLGTVTQPRPPIGIVAAVPVGSATITVTAGGVNYPLPFESTYSPVVGDQVYILWPGTSRAGLVMAKVGSTPAPLPPPAAPPPPPGGSTSGVDTFAAVSVGTYRSGWRNDDAGDVIQGVAPGFAGNNEGAWFYGGRIPNTLGGATVTGVEIWLGRTSGGVFGAQTCNIYRVADNDRPAGALTFGTGPTGVSLAVGQAGWFGLPPSLGQELVNSGGSIGIKGSPYMRMYGLSKSGQAGALRIYWRR